MKPFHSAVLYIILSIQICTTAWDIKCAVEGLKNAKLGSSGPPDKTKVRNSKTTKDCITSDWQMFDDNMAVVQSLKESEWWCKRVPEHNLELLIPSTAKPDDMAWICCEEFIRHIEQRLSECQNFLHTEASSKKWKHCSEVIAELKPAILQFFKGQNYCEITFREPNDSNDSLGAWTCAWKDGKFFNL